MTKLKKETLLLQSQIMHKVKVIESLDPKKSNNKRLSQLNVLWAEILKTNNRLELEYRAQEAETKSWMAIAADNIKLSHITISA